jgi:hypothetical protein
MAVLQKMFLAGLIGTLGGCANHFQGTLVDTVYAAPAGDRITMSVAYTGHECPGQVPPMVTAWQRTGAPERVLTVHGEMVRKEGLTKPPVREARAVDADHVVMLLDGELVGSFDYDHARAYYGAEAQPAWAKGAVAAH